MPSFILKWRPQIFNDMLATLLANSSITDIYPGSAATTLLNAPAVEDARQYAMMVKILEAFVIDLIEGTDLDDKGFEYSLTRYQPGGSTGFVTVSDSTFSKVATQIYPGLVGPVSGSTAVNIIPVTGLSASGSVIIGRGSANTETIAYSSITDNGSYLTLNLSTGLANDHGTEESVILSQGGNRTIASGTVVYVQQNDTSPKIEFTIDAEYTLLDGEDTLDGVACTCSTTGSVTNIPAGSIQNFNTSPFNGARIINPLPFTNGRDQESDQDFRDRIKNHGVTDSSETGIITAITGLIDEDDNKRVVSGTYVKGVNTYDTVYIDDGTGFEPTFEGQGFETVIQEAAGSEKTIQLQNYPVVKASLVTGAEQPFSVSSGDTLIIDVDGTTETLTFQAGDILNDGFATAIEISARINASSNLVEARTTDNGKKVIITTIQDTNERLQILGGSGNTGLVFVENIISETLKLYKNDQYLYKDGRPARIETANLVSDMVFTGGPFTFQVIIDGKSANPITVTINSADFVNPSTPTAQEVADAINGDLFGAFASPILNGTKIRLECTSDAGTSSKIEVVSGGSALGSNKLDFETDVEHIGIAADYILNRFNGQIILKTPLVILDRIEAGSRATRAFFDCQSPGPYIINSGETLVIGGNDSIQTYTFGSSGTYTAQEIVDMIYADRLTSNVVNGFGFESVNKGGQDYLRVYANDFDIDQIVLVDSSSTATALDFVYDIAHYSILSNVAYSKTQNDPLYIIGPDQNLIVQLDGDPVNRTFSVAMEVPSTVSSGTNATHFSASSLAAIYTDDDFFKGFNVRFDDNTTTALLQSQMVEVLSYNGTTGAFVLDTGLSATPAIGDTFVLLPVDAVNVKELLSKKEHTPLSVYANIETVQEGDGVQISSKKNGSEGEVQVIGGTANAISIPFTSDGTISGTFQTSTIAGLSKGLLITLDDDDSSPLNVEITGISGTSAPYTITVDSGATNLSAYTVAQNAVVKDRKGLNFTTSLKQGVDGYKNFIGLLRTVQRTIDGWDADLSTYPGIKAAGARIQVNSPVINLVDIAADVTPATGVNIISIQDEIKSVIASYINSLKVGQDIVISELIVRIKQVNGVYDVKILSPSTNFPIADNALARTTIDRISIS